MLFPYVDPTKYVDPNPHLAGLILKHEFQPMEVCC